MIAAETFSKPGLSMLSQVQYAVAAFRRLQDEAILEGMLGKSHIFDSYFSPDNIIPSVPKNDFYSTFITQIIVR